VNPELWWVQVSPLLIGVLSAFLAILFDAWAKRTAAAFIILTGLVLSAVQSVYLASIIAPALILDLLIIDRGFYGVWAAVYLLTGFALLTGLDYVVNHPSGGGVAALAALLASGSVALVSSVDLLFTLIMLELVAFAGYGLIASARTSASQEATLKYIVQGSVVTGMFVLGLAIVASRAGGSFDLVTAGEGIAASATVAAAATLIFVIALSFKLGAFPFHSWVPDAYQSAHPAGTSLIVAVPKIGALSAMFLVAEVLMRPLAGSQVAPLQPTLVFSVLAIASIIFGNLGALRQHDFGRMLGYSAVAQAGYALIGLAVGLLTFPGAMLLMTVYGLAASTAFAVAVVLRSERRSWDGSIRGMSGLAACRPWLAAALAISMLSLTGIPLTAGFWGKLSVFGPAAGEGFVALAIAGVLGSVLSFAYYGSVIRAVYFDQSPDAQSTGASRLPTETPIDENSRFRTVPGIASITGAGALIIIGIAPLFIGLTPFVRFFGIGG